MNRKKTLNKRIKWWWNTRIKGFFRVKMPIFFKRHFESDKQSISFQKNAHKFDKFDKNGITVILTAYRRVEYLSEQIKALRNQTIPPKEIWVWSNKSPEELLDISNIADRVVVSNTNWLFWGRFSLASLARTGYIAFLDDDILPQPRWFENCLTTISNGYDGILGGSGVLLPVAGGYSSKNKVGWNGEQLTETVQVDLVGHAWFMKKNYLKYMWYEEPYSWENGEDIHLSYMALKYGGIKTYVPPHPHNDESLWSCRPDFGRIVGRKKVATYKTNHHKQIRTDIVNYFIKDGWQNVTIMKTLITNNE